MKTFAEFILSGYGRAVVCITGMAWLAAFMPLTGVVSSAALGLTALVWGGQRAAITAMLSIAALYGLFVLASVLNIAVASYESIFLFVLLQWLPLLLIAQLLRATRSLSFTLIMLVVVGSLIVVLTKLLVPDIADYWDRFFNWVLQGEIASKETDDPEFGQDYRNFLNIITGLAVASLILVWMVSLLLARWWQSLLNQPGGFRSEFVRLELGRIIAVTGLILFAVMIFSDSPLTRELLLVMMVAFLFQGISTVHFLLAARDAKGWLLGFYVLLAMSPVIPQVPGLLGIVGALENLVGLRARMRVKLEQEEKEKE